VTALDDPELAAPGAVLQAVGRALISRTGGASGPLYGMAFRQAGKALGDEQDVPAERLGTALHAALAGVRQLGGAAPGDKTMVDALGPAVAAYQEALDGTGDLVAAASAAADAAERGLGATVDLAARKGRASYLGERAIGHEDPGAASSSHARCQRPSACDGSYLSSAMETPLGEISRCRNGGGRAPW
jgi:dihydroxyacetone kinase-like protein